MAFLGEEIIYVVLVDSPFPGDIVYFVMLKEGMPVVPLGAAVTLDAAFGAFAEKLSV